MAKASDVLNVMRSWIGHSETNKKYLEILNIYNSHKPLARNYAIKPYDEWCDCTVSAAAIKAGAVDLIGTEVSCQRHIDIFKAKGIWIEDGTVKPQVGDIIVFNWDDNTQANDGWADHIAYVEEVNGNTIICIEGNKNEKVDRRTINVGWGYIRGFARPKYEKEVVAVKPAPKKPINQIANEVIQGAWGTGNARKSALTKAGYDYVAVQAAVNAILAKPTKKPVVTVAKEVIEGKWGTGEARKTALTKAGYDYNTVQKKVNELLSKKSITVIAKEVIAGKWGKGNARKSALTKAGYDYDAVQKKVNELMA